MTVETRQFAQLKKIIKKKNIRVQEQAQLEETLQAMKLQNTDLNTQNVDGQALLSLAAVNGHEKVIDNLIAAGVKVTDLPKTAGVASPLVVAIQHKHDKIAEILIEKGAPGVEDGSLQLAVGLKDSSLAHKIIAKASKEQLEKRPYVIYLAAMDGKGDIIEAMKKKGVNINSTFRREVDYYMYSFSALHEAIKCNDKVAVKLLLEKGADVNLCPKNGVTPLSYAIERGNRDMINLLIQEGANLNTTSPEFNDHYVDKVQYTPLMLAVKHNKQYVIDRLLIEKGKGKLEINTVTKHGFEWQSTLSLAVQAGNIKAAQKLVAAGADSIRNPYGNLGTDSCSVYIAAKRGYKDLVIQMLIKAKEKEPNTPLQNIIPYYMTAGMFKGIINEAIKQNKADLLVEVLKVTSLYDKPDTIKLNIESAFQGHNVMKAAVTCIEQSAELSLDKSRQALKQLDEIYGKRLIKYSAVEKQIATAIQNKSAEIMLSKNVNEAYDEIKKALPQDNKIVLPAGISQNLFKPENASKLINLLELIKDPKSQIPQELRLKFLGEMKLFAEKTANSAIVDTIQEISKKIQAANGASLPVDKEVQIAPNNTEITLKEEPAKSTSAQAAEIDADKSVPDQSIQEVVAATIDQTATPTQQAVAATTIVPAEENANNEQAPQQATPGSKNNHNVSAAAQAAKDLAPEHQELLKSIMDTLSTYDVQQLMDLNQRIVGVNNNNNKVQLKPKAVEHEDIASLPKEVLQELSKKIEVIRVQMEEAQKEKVQKKEDILPENESSSISKPTNRGSQGIKF
jgi:ankyrin repeat protein